jgi:hypothetical protein
MAFQDVPERGRVAAFLSNGGGTITFRVALSAVAAVTLLLLQSFGSHIISQLDEMSRAQSRMAVSLASLAQQGSDTARLAARNSEKLDDHEHRITIIEARAPRR